VQVLAEDRVSIFLDSIRRGSKNTKKLYYTSLNHFTEFLKQKNKKQTPNTIILSLKNGEIDIYELLDQFVPYLASQGVSPFSLKVYVSAVRSYLEFSDIDIVPSKFRRRVKLPKYYPDQEEPLPLADIRKLLEFNSNHRLRTFLLLLVSSGMRAMEACSLRLQDMDFSVSPTLITIRRDYSKTKRARAIYCSDEATTHIKKLIEMYPSKGPQDFIFAIVKNTKHPESIYLKLLRQFQKLQSIADKNQRKENSRRHKITLHSFRRTAFSIINEQTNSEYANWYLGHHHSVYWTHKESERQDIYRTRCMPFLTIYQETRDNTIESTLKEKDREIALLKRDMHSMRDEWHALLSEPEKFMAMLQEGRGKKS
jgi:integrase